EVVRDRDRVSAIVEMAPFLTEAKHIEQALLLVPEQKGGPHGWPVAALNVRLAELGNSQSALAKARAIVWPAHRLHALAGIAAKMLSPPPTEQIQEVLETTRLPSVQRSLASGFGLEDNPLLALVLRLAAEGRVDEALAGARAFPDFGTSGGAGTRVEALTQLASRLPGPTMSQTLREALAAARLVGDGRTRVMIVAKLLRQVPAPSADAIQAVLQAALSVVPLIGKDDERAEALGQLAAFLTPPLLEKALD